MHHHGIFSSLSSNAGLLPYLCADQSCLVQYNGCSWKGSKLRVEAARPDPLVKYAKERLAEDLPAPEPSASAPVPQNSTLQEASDMPSFALTQPASGKVSAASCHCSASHTARQHAYSQLQ